MIIFKRFENIILGFFVRNGRRNKLTQAVRFEGEFLLLVRLLLTHDGFNHIGIQFAVYGELTQFDGLCMGGRRVIVGNLLHKAFLFVRRKVRELDSRAMPLNYADYYFLEALMRKRDLEK